jgi:hypothetical protein
MRWEDLSNQEKTALRKLAKGEVHDVPARMIRHLAALGLADGSPEGHHFRSVTRSCREISVLAEAPRKAHCRGWSLRNGSGDREGAADWRRRTLSADDRSELRLEGINLARQLDGAEQLGPLADNAAQLAGFVRRKLAFCDARKEIAEYLGAILCRLQRPSARSACLRARP